MKTEAPSGADQPIMWHAGILVSGHGVASGRAPDCPYPAGTIAMQAPLFLEHGLDLSRLEQATLNLDFAPGEWRLRDPDHHMPLLRWCEQHPPETFSFWSVVLRRLVDSPAGVVSALIYYPHPETKRAHHHSASRLELLAPPLPGVTLGERFEVGIDPRRCRLIQPARLRARLLEFLKFRVLAAQDSFFCFGEPLASGAHSVGGLRRWLASAWPEACDLSDDDLLLTLEQARALYTEGP